MTSQQRTPDPDSAREEAQRLVATGLAAMSVVADRIGAPTRERGGAAAAGYEALGDMLFGPAGHRRHSVANDSPECCKCPVCRAISAAREPSPRVTERIAAGVGTVAEGAARVVQNLTGAAGATARPGRDGDVWAAATAEPVAVAEPAAAGSPEPTAEAAGR